GRRRRRLAFDTSPVSNSRSRLRRLLCPPEPKEAAMKYVILIHANPDPWGHPTSHFTAEGRALPAAHHAEMDRQFEELLTEISASGELVMAEALADPASATVYDWSPEGHLATD